VQRAEAETDSRGTDRTGLPDAGSADVLARRAQGFAVAKEAAMGFKSSGDDKTADTRAPAYGRGSALDEVDVSAIQHEAVVHRRREARSA